MKKISIIKKLTSRITVIGYCLLVIGLTSCQDMFEPADENTRSENALIEESEYAHGLLIYAYDRLPDVRETQTDIATDDAVINTSSTYRTMALGTWQSNNNPMTRWDDCKDGIQYVNKFLTKVENVKWAPSDPSKQQMFIDRLKGEALGLRAIFYYLLLQAHGGYTNEGELLGVPLLTAPEDGSSDYNQARASFADCVRQIFADCDQAADLLPLTYGDISKSEEIPSKYPDAIVSGYNSVFGDKAKNLFCGAAAKAVKAQAALLAASPAFRDKSGVSSEEAANICAAALDDINWEIDPEGNIWYKSSKVDAGSSEMREIVWRYDRGDMNTTQEKKNFPPSMYGSGQVNPSQNLVDAFPMANGYPISAEGSGYDAKDPYTNRDPRLSHYIVFNGAKINKNYAEIVTGLYPNSKPESVDNLENQSTSTRTGYYMLKLLRPDVDAKSSAQIPKYHLYPRIRYTEIFLAYAEAANDAWGPKENHGHQMSAYDVIKAIRERGGLPADDPYLEECANDNTGAKMTELIRNERRIELCFENKRFWDMRRWKLALDEPVKGMKIEKIDATQGAMPDNLTYNIFKVEDRVFDNSYQHYGPVPRGELLKWSNLKQNKGWD
jgi:hypothetical protein